MIGIDESDLDSLKIVKFADRKRLMNGIKTLSGREVKPFDASSYSSKTSKYSTETGSVTSETDLTEEFDSKFLNFHRLYRLILLLSSNYR